MVNYIRSEVAKGNTNVPLESATAFNDDQYLQPVLEDDAVLFSLDELIDTLGEPDAKTSATEISQAAPDDPKIQELQHQLQILQRQFTDYRLAVEQTLEQRWTESNPVNLPSGPGPSSTTPTHSEGSRLPTSALDKATSLAANVASNDATYFDSYAYNDIHELMLRDAVRTDAYRDFIYDNKSLFADKTVLDIGTGTSILAMFAAKAGAKTVYAVDNSNVIEKATDVVKDNGLSDIVHCIRGRVEDVVLSSRSPSQPNPKQKEAQTRTQTVDIIISEWMGYGLLFESMLDSVLHARDRFLAPGGLMAPSHTTLRIAPLTDSDYILDTLHFWDEVYGFDMRAMSANICEDVHVKNVDKETVVGAPATFKVLNLYEVGVKDLEFEKAEFVCEVLEDEVDGLSAWAIWFDTFFLPERTSELPADAVAEEWKGKGNAFTTGPWGKETHWKSVVCPIDHAQKRKLIDGTVVREGANIAPIPLEKGMTINGSVGYKKREGNAREIEIEIAWEVVGTREVGRQVWLLR